MSEVFTFKNYIKDFFHIKKNVYCLLLLIILSFHTYLKTIELPKLLANMSFSSITSIIPFLYIFLLYFILNICYIQNGHIFSRYVHKFSYYYIFEKLMIIREGNLNHSINSSTYVSIIAFINDLTSFIQAFFAIIPYLFSIVFIGYFLFTNISFSLGIYYLILTCIQFFLLYSKIQKTINSLSKFNFLRNHLIDFNQDININMQQIISLNGQNKEKEKLKRNAYDIIPYYKKYQYHRLTQVFLINFSNVLFLIIGIIFITKTGSIHILKSYIFIFSYHIYLSSESITILNNLSYFSGMVKSSYINIINNVNNVKNDYIKKRSNNISYAINDAILGLRNINFSYNKKVIFENLKLNFQLRKTYAIIGKIGSGKSTLLKILFGINHFSGGNVFLGDQNIRETDIEKWRNNFNYFQQTSTLFSRSITENIFYPNSTYSQDELELLKKVGIYDIINDLLKKPEKEAKLSGGQMQIVLLTRLLFNPKKVILLDEPTSALDNQTKNYVIKIVQYLKDIGSTLIIVTHDIEIMNIVDEVVDLNLIKQ